MPVEAARRAAFLEGLDWSFATVEGAVQALLAADTSRAAPPAAVMDFVRRDIVRDAAGRYRFSYEPEAVIGAWIALTSATPSIAAVPTLLLRAEASHLDWSDTNTRYRTHLGEMLTSEVVPGGHNLLWSAAEETSSLVERFVDR